MKLSNRILQNLSAEQVRRINEIYHDLENVDYDVPHQYIAQFEQSFWQRAAETYLPQGRPIVWLDYGTGTGFVPSVIGEYLDANDSLVCCDISAEMLRICAERLERRSYQRSFRKIDGSTIPAADGSVDVLSVNSVLHHIFDLPAFAAECARVLKPSGLLIVAHEPNRNTHLPLTGRLLRGLVRTVLRPKTMILAVVEHCPVAERLLRGLTSRTSARYRRRNQMLAEVARQVREEHIVEFELRGTEVQRIVDFHSEQGFDRAELLGRVFGQFTSLEFQTYGHLGFFPNGRVSRAAEQYLKARWPGAGGAMCFVLALRAGEGSRGPASAGK